MKELTQQIKQWGEELGFQQTAITDIQLNKASAYFIKWLENGFHGDMGYLSQHGNKRTQPEKLIEGTIRVITTRMNYFSPIDDPWQQLHTSNKGYISCYALGRDYHKLMRKRLKQLAEKINLSHTELNYRVFVDSAPVLEKPLAQKSGLGWIGKHTNLINQHQGSWFFLGEIYINLPLPIDKETESHCGTCQSCMDICPTQAIIAPYQLDARKCISYLTIENKGSIPEHFRKPIGNRIYGCDDCQLICPWNKFSKTSLEKDFHRRNIFIDSSLQTLFSWNETTFLKNTEGSAIRRIGYISWLRNIAVALGNDNTNPTNIKILQMQLSHPSEIVQEHVQWALSQINQANNST